MGHTNDLKLSGNLFEGKMSDLNNTSNRVKTMVIRGNNKKWSYIK